MLHSTLKDTFLGGSKIDRRTRAGKKYLRDCRLATFAPMPDFPNIHPAFSCVPFRFIHNLRKEGKHKQRWN